MAAAVKATGDAASAAGAGRVAGEGMALTLSVQGKQGRWGVLTSTPRTAPLGEISAPRPAPRAPERPRPRPCVTIPG